MARGSRSYYLWLAATILGALLLLGALAQFYIVYGGGKAKAIAEGKYIEINLKTGEITQRDAHADEEADAPAAHEQEAAPPTAEEAHHEAPAPVADQPAEVTEAHPAAADAAHPQAEAAHQPVEAPATAPSPDAVFTPEAAATAGPAPTASASVPAAAPVGAAQKKPRIAVVMVGLGLSRSSTEAALALPQNVALSFSPYAFDLTQWMDKAGAARERYLDLPLEPVDYPYSDPGPFALLTGQEEAKNQERLEQVLGRATGYTGLVSGADERFTENATSFTPLLSMLKEKNLFYVYLARNENYRLQQANDAIDASLLGADYLIDKTLSSDGIAGTLADMEKKALESGYAVGMARPYPVTIKQLQLWIAGLAAKGIELVPLSSLKPGHP